MSNSKSKRPKQPRRNPVQLLIEKKARSFVAAEKAYWETLSSDSRGGALGAFSTRTSLAYVLGLISKPLFRDLQVLAELRNDVAHMHFVLDFSMPRVRDHCKELQYVSTLRNGNTSEPLIDEQMCLPRNRFVLTAIMTANRLLLTALGVTRVRRV